MTTYDSRTIDSTGAFLIGELERLDQTIHDPLYTVTWGRDIDLREDVTIADEQSSFTNSTFAGVGGINPNGKNFIGKDTNAIAGVALDIAKTVNPLFLWGMELSYTIPELESAQKIGRPVDVTKLNAIKVKWNMDIDEMVYKGDTTVGYTGLINNTNVSVTNAGQAGPTSPTGNTTSTLWADKTPDAILADLNSLLANAWAASGWAYTPSKVILPPIKFGYLVSQKVSTAGNMSVLEYLRINSLSNANNGRPLDIVPAKWMTGAGSAGADRMVAYTQDRNLVRYPLVPMQRTPLEYRSIWQLTTYFGRLGVMEFPYPETLYYMDGI